MCADDVALTCYDKQTSVIEHTISKDLDCVSEYYRKWHLKLSTTKSVSSIFHLKNHLAQYQLQVHLSGNSIPLTLHLVVTLGVTLDRSLTFSQYIEKLKNKMTCRVALVKRLAGLNWGACFDVLRIPTLSLAVAPAESCCPVSNQSSHTNKLNTPFNEALRNISGCIKPTRVSFLLFLAGIEPLESRRLYACEKLLRRANNKDNPLHQMMHSSHKLARLRSCHPLRNLDLTISAADHTVSEDLTEFIQQWSKEPSGCKLRRKHSVQLNKLRSRFGQSADDMHCWGLIKTSACDCGSEVQTYTQVLLECPIWKPPCNLTEVDNLLLQNYLHNCNF